MSANIPYVRWIRVLGVMAMVAAAAGIAITFAPMAAAPAHAGQPGATIVALAEQEANNSGRNYEADIWGNPSSTNCTYYAGQLNSSWPSCGPSGWGWRGGSAANDNVYAWCATFNRYIWKIAGLSSYTEVDTWAQSFKAYGENHGTWHARGTYIPQPGDSVLYDTDHDPNDDHPMDHVGIVRYVSSGTLYTVEGNWNNKVSYVTRTNYNSNSDIIGFTTPVEAGGGERVGLLKSDGTLIVKEGALDAAWVTMTGPGVVEFELTATRVGVRYGDGHIYVKEGALNSGWVDEGVSGVALQLAGDRIGYQNNAGQVFVKEGALNAGWVNLGLTARSFKLSPQRVALLRPDQTLQVKDGALNSAWVDMGVTVLGDDYQVSDGRIGVHRASNGDYDIKQGALNGSWVSLKPAGCNGSFALSDNRVAIQCDDSRIVVQEGVLTSQFTNMGIYATTAGFDVSDTRLGIRSSGTGETYVIAGTLTNAWTAMGVIAPSFELSHP